MQFFVNYFGTIHQIATDKHSVASYQARTIYLIIAINVVRFVLLHAFPVHQTWSRLMFFDYMSMGEGPTIVNFEMGISMISSYFLFKAFYVKLYQNVKFKQTFERVLMSDDRGNFLLNRRISIQKRTLSAINMLFPFLICIREF